MIRVMPLRKAGVRAINLPRSREAEHEVIVSCKADPDVKVVRIDEVKFIPTRIDAGSWMWSMRLTQPGCPRSW
jgi:hypothetical protein